MARATPTKQTGELKERLRREEERVAELRVELGQLQRQLDTRTAEHEREINRVKLASQQVGSSYGWNFSDSPALVVMVAEAPVLSNLTSPRLWTTSNPPTRSCRGTGTCRR